MHSKCFFIEFLNHSLLRLLPRSPGTAPSLAGSPSGGLWGPWPCWQPHHALPPSRSSQRLGVARTLRQDHPWGTGTPLVVGFGSRAPHPVALGVCSLSSSLPSVLLSSTRHQLHQAEPLYPHRWSPHTTCACFHLCSFLGGPRWTQTDKKRRIVLQAKNHEFAQLHFGSKRMENGWFILIYGKNHYSIVKKKYIKLNKKIIVQSLKKKKVENKNIYFN